MTDYGAQYTDKQIAQYERRVKSIYSEAQKDIERKMRDYNRRYKAKEKQYKKAVKAGTMAQEDFDEWKRRRVFDGKIWQAKRDDITNTLTNANKVATKLANGQLANVFGTNANWMSYQLEKGAKANLGFTLYDSTTVANLIKNQPNLINYKYVDAAKDAGWNSKKITRQITQGVIQGEDLDTIAKRLAETTGSDNMNAMLTQARTMMTGAQNAGRWLQLKEMKKMGIPVKGVWIATLDSHTRDTHRTLDGQAVDPDDVFRVGQYKIRYPGDPQAVPAMTYNCRCTLGTEIEKVSAVYKRRDNTTGEIIEDMTYREWESWKKTGALPERLAGGKTSGGAPATFADIVRAATTVSEVTSAMNGRGWFKTESRFVQDREAYGMPWKQMDIETQADLTGCDIEAARSIAETYNRVYERYPALKGKFVAPDAQPVGMSEGTYAWCYTRNGGKVQVNPNRFGDWAKLKTSYAEDVASGWHTEGTTADSIVMHEIGHSIDGLLSNEGVLGGYTASGRFKYASSTLKTRVMKLAAKEDSDIAEGMKLDRALNDTWTVQTFVSRYATKNSREWFAECFAEYMTSENPRTVARIFGEELEKLIGELK